MGYHEKMMNIPRPSTRSRNGPHYAAGHRDARHAAAEIAAEADAEIDALKAQLAEAEARATENSLRLIDSIGQMEVRAIAAEARAERAWRLLREIGVSCEPINNQQSFESDLHRRDWMEGAVKGIAAEILAALREEGKGNG